MGSMTPTRPARRRPPSGRVLGAWTVGALLSLLAFGPPALAQPIERIQSLIDQGDAQGALGLLGEVKEDRRQPQRSAQLFLLRSTARFMLGEREGGIADLDKALRLDPSLRQGWLNRGALDLSERRYGDASSAFEKARELDPQAVDNDLNLGVPLVLLGRIDEARQRFARYIERSERPAEAHLLVAKNFALGSQLALALTHLEQAIGIDERQRLIAKSDPAFGELARDPRFQRLLHTDNWVPPLGAWTEERTFDATYDAGRGPLLGAVIDALARLGIAYDSRIDVAPEWAVVWSKARIKVSALPDGRGTVTLQAAREALSRTEWQDLVDRLLAQIDYQLTPRIPR